LYTTITPFNSSVDSVWEIMGHQHHDHLHKPLMEYEEEELGCAVSQDDYVTRETKSIYEEAAVLVRFALPLGISHASGQLYDITDQIILGRLGTDFLAGAASAFIWTSLIDSVLFATIEQLTTLCSQAWGAGNYPLVGEWLHLWLVASSLLAIPAMIARWYTETVLFSFFGLSDTVSALAGSYAHIRQFSVPFDVVYLCAKAYLCSQGIVSPAMNIELFFVLVNGIMAYTFVFPLALGLEGAAIASSLTTALRACTFFLYAFVFKKFQKSTWFGFDWSTAVFNWDRWKTYFAMSVNALGVMAEGIVWQIMSCMAARLGNAQLAAHDLSLSVLGLLAVFGSGLGAAIGVRLGAALGDKRIAAAKKTYRVGISLTFFIGLILGGIELGLGDFLASFASTDPEVLSQMSTLRPYVALVISLQLIWWPIYEVLLKQGRAAIAGLITALCGIAFMLPIAYVCTSVLDLGITGIWLGILGGYSIAMAIELWMISSSDWVVLAKKARIRSEVNSPI
jgi:MATE family multidrug resistance protein